MKNCGLITQLFVGAIVVAVILTLTPNSIWAQESPPGFDFRIEVDHLAEQSKGSREVNVTDVGARAGYIFPRHLELYAGLCYQDIDFKSSHDSVAEKINLDAALAFRLGTKIYLVKSIPIGVPADITLTLSYNTASHEEEDTNEKYKHNRFIVTGGIEWRYASATPFLNLGLLNSRLKGPEDNYDQNSLLFSVGSNFKLFKDIYFRMEANWCQEVGYSFGLQYRF